MQEDWKELAAEKRWADIDYDRLPDKDLPAVTQLLNAIKEDVGTKVLHNGTDKLEVPRTAEDINTDPEIPEDRKRHLCAAADVLELQTLEAIVEGEPNNGQENWESLLEGVHLLIKEQAEKGEVTEGDDQLSRAAHVARAQEWRDELNFIMLSWQAGYHGEDKEDVVAHDCEVAYAAARMISSLMSGLSKDEQKLLVTGRKVTEGGSNGGNKRVSNLSPIKLAESKRRDELASRTDLTMPEKVDIMSKEFPMTSSEAHRQALRRRNLKT